MERRDRETERERDRRGRKDNKKKLQERYEHKQENDL